MFRKCQSIFVTGLVLLICVALPAQTISNVDFFTQGETIIITYDLSGCSSGEKQDIQLHFEYRSGQRITPITLQGDYQEVPCGTGKQIIWQVKEDLEELQGECKALLSIVPKFKTVQIGTQEWMVENLNVSTFQNGDQIPEAKSIGEWEGAGRRNQPAFCYYENNQSNGAIYGKLYNWYTVVDQRGICPPGWHLPSDIEWTVMTDFLNEDVGNKMKNISGWDRNGNGSNLSGFSGLPGGYRDGNGVFYDKGEVGNWWSSEEFNERSAWRRSLYYFNGNVGRYYPNKGRGLSVRCIRD